ncbi:MAG: hypothetical protein WAW52_07555 [Methanothrix sp.]
MLKLKDLRSSRAKGTSAAKKNRVLQEPNRLRPVCVPAGPRARAAPPDRARVSEELHY